MRTVIELRLNPESVTILEEYVKRFGKTLMPRTEFHSTVYYSEEIHLCRDESSTRYLSERLPIKLDPKTYLLGVFGQNKLVLKYEHDAVREIEMFLRKRKNENFFSKEYSSFSPHITLGENFHRKHLEYEMPSFGEALALDSFSWTFKNNSF